jgi:glycosyltransferase involved in cell wall biosynthesis
LVYKVLIDGRKIDDFGVGTHMKAFLSQIKDNKIDGFSFEIILKKKKKEIPLKQYIFPFGEYNPLSFFFFGLFTRTINHNLLYNPFFNYSIFSKDTIITVHDLIHLKFKNFYKKKFGYLFYKPYISYSIKKAKKIIVVSETTKKELEENFPQAKNKIFKVPNSTEPLFYKNYKFKKENYFCFIGNNKPHKNLKFLLDFWLDFSKNNNEYYLYLICPIDINIQNVKVFKNLNTKDLIEILGKAKALLSPSIWEGFNLPLLEAILLKTIPIASSIPANIELLGNDYPFLFNINNKEELKTKLEFLLKNYENFLDIFNNLNVRENSPENLAKNILEVIKSLI